MKIKDLMKLKEEYGDVTITEIINTKRLPHICPKCEGKGVIITKYDAYPLNLPDSGWAHDWKTKEEDCKVCNGEGYTIRPLKPIIKTEIIGYEYE